MIRPPAPPTRMENLMDFQDTVQRGDTIEAMEMQRLGMQPMSMPMNQMPMAVPMNQMPRKNGGLVSLPVANRFLGGIIGSAVSSLAPSLVGRALISSGSGLAIGGVGATLTSFLTDKILGRKTNIKRNIIQGIAPVAGSYLRGGPTNIMPGDSAAVQSFGLADVGGSIPPPANYGAQFMTSLGDQFTRDNLEEIFTESMVADALSAEEPESLDSQSQETGKKKNTYKGLGLQKRVLADRRLDDPREFDPSDPRVNQAEAYKRSIGEAIRKRQRPRYKYIKSTKGGGLAGLDFEGRVPGRSDGMEDDQYYAIREAGGHVEGLLAVSPKEYVVPADTMSILGNGNPDAGADAMDQFVKNVRVEAYGTPNQQKELNGLQTINRNLRG